MAPPSRSNTKPFKTPEAFAKWLLANHDSCDELYLKIYKKASKKPTVTWTEAVIEALCWGWIDSIKKSLDDEAYLQRFSPRKRRSNWSKINRGHVERLLKEGRMQEPGMVHVRAAQADGRWEAAYTLRDMKVPKDFLEALDKKPKARAFFDTLNKSNRTAIAYQLETAKKPETRKRRFKKYLDMMRRQEKLH